VFQFKFDLTTTKACTPTEPMELIEVEARQKEKKKETSSKMQ